MKTVCQIVNITDFNLAIVLSNQCSTLFYEKIAIRTKPCSALNPNNLKLKSRTRPLINSEYSKKRSIDTAFSFAPKAFPLWRFEAFVGRTRAELIPLITLSLGNTLGSSRRENGSLGVILRIHRYSSRRHLNEKELNLRAHKEAFCPPFCAPCYAL